MQGGAKKKGEDILEGRREDEQVRGKWKEGCRGRKIEEVEGENKKGRREGK